MPTNEQATPTGATARFEDVTLLITHYNRSRSLKRLLDAFIAIGCSFGDIVVSDDGSRPEHLSVLQTLEPEYGFRLITTPRNRGLGNNINKGQDAVQTLYTLYVQEDFIPLPPLVARLQQSMAMMEQDQTLDSVRYYSYLPYPYTKPYADGFSQMLFSAWGTDYTKIYAYSDHPHLRRSTFMDKFGRYSEVSNSDKTEYQMCVRFLQKRGKGLLYDNFKELFAQENDADEPSTFDRAPWTKSKNPAIAIVRDAYRQVKYNRDIWFM